MKRILMIVLAVTVTACGSGVLAPVPVRVKPDSVKDTNTFVPLPHKPAVDCVDSTFTKIIPCPNSGN